jgi:hypothetical protein
MGAARARSVAGKALPPVAGIAGIVPRPGRRAATPPERPDHGARLGQSFGTTQGHGQARASERQLAGAAAKTGYPPGLRRPSPPLASMTVRLDARQPPRTTRAIGVAALRDSIQLPCPVAASSLRSDESATQLGSPPVVMRSRPKTVAPLSHPLRFAPVKPRPNWGAAS